MDNKTNKPTYEELEAQLAAAIAAERVWETAMIAACGEDGPKSVAEKFAQLEAQVKQLSAENAGLRAMSDDRRTFIMNGVQLGYIKVPTVETDPALETIRIAVSPQEPTPSTDAYLSQLRNEARAKGVDLAVEHVRSIQKVPNPVITIAFSLMGDFARQLRESKAGEVQS